MNLYPGIYLLVFIILRRIILQMKSGYILLVNVMFCLYIKKIWIFIRLISC